MDGDYLYVTNNMSNQIIVYDLVKDEASGEVSATLNGFIESPFFDSPATSALYGGMIYSVNARFASLPFPAEGEDDPSTFDEEFTIVATEARA